MISKKAQGLSLNVIIIAALALIVLVVLVVIFTGRTAVFERGVSKEGRAELVVMKIQYGDCRPTATSEANFDSQLTQAASVEGKDQAKSTFREEIGRCKALVDKGSCEAGGCSWG